MPTVVIPHDIQFRTVPHQYTAGRRLMDGILYGLDFRLRDRIVAVSDFDATEIRRFYPRWAEKVVRIYNPILFAAAAAGDSPPPVRPYLLAINIAYPHKNTLTLLRAFESLRGRIPHDLVLVGKLEPWNRYLPEFVAARGLGDRVIFAGYVDEERLHALLRGAAVYVSPSLYEGFGMTPIEAIGAGVPVVSSRHPATLETTRGLAGYYDPPEDHRALAAALEAVLAAPPDAAERARRQAAVRGCYDHRVIAEEYWTVLQDAAGRAAAAR
jgi:glycosyltransferase involved in cell wall biosynthesis